MLLKVNLSKTDQSKIYAIAHDRIIAMQTNGADRLDLIFDMGYSEQNSVISFKITPNAGDTVMRCLNDHVSRHITSTIGPICTIFDAYSGYKCCTDIIDCAVFTRKIG